MDSSDSLIRGHLANDAFQHSQDMDRQQMDHFARSQEDSVALQTNIGHFEDHRQAFRTFLEKYDCDRQALLALAEKDDQQTEKEQLQSVFAWFAASAADQLEYHDNLCTVWNPSLTTGRWILSEPAVKHLINAKVPEHPIVWINGKKGAGS